MRRRKHADEIIRFANSKEGTKVWFSHQFQSWKLTDEPIWSDGSKYIVDDGWAELRKAEADGKIIEARLSPDIWSKHIINEEFAPSYYRIQPDEIIYYYQWERLEMNNNRLVTSPFYVSDSEAIQLRYKDKGWRKKESSKRTWNG